MNKLSQTATQSIADLTQGIGVRQLTEQHCHKLRPTGESFGATFGLMSCNQSGKFCPWEMFQKLIKQTRDLYHWAALLLELVLTPLPSKAGVEREKLEGFLLRLPIYFKYCFGREGSQTAPTKRKR